MISLDHIRFSGADTAPPRRYAFDGRRSPFRDTFTHFTAARQENGEVHQDLAWILAQAGLDAHAYRPSVLERRVSSCLRKLGVNSITSARCLLSRRPDLVQNALSTLLLGVSNWFRDPGVFADLERIVLPQLLKRQPGLRVLSAGCSDGQELYSIAILLEEQGVLERSSLLGLDCRADAIRTASDATYPADCLTEIAPERYRFFEICRRSARVNAHIRAAVTWRQENLLNCGHLEQWDVILFRNVAIYIGESRARTLWDRLYGSLTLGGVLVTGKAERPPQTPILKRLESCIYQKGP